uniref:Cation-dependent mannose-6-phosphate receptor n=2 Tax=Cynoglossus semilaevis TaxID=244447 RepID=A0A3P8X3I4_CYNSE
MLQLLLFKNVICAEGINNCKLLYESKSDWKILKQLEPLVGKNFSVVNTTAGESYTYVFQLCGDAGGVPGAGIIQVDSKGDAKKTTVIGMYNATQAFGGDDLMMLIYQNGEAYDSHCSKENRRAFVMISCNRDKVGQLEVLLEERERQQDCFYLFKLESSSICPALPSGLSTGSILLIIMICFLAIYLVGGFLYQRLIVGAKGVEQFPNHNFWVEVGNLSADGCDFVCRSRSREEPSAYTGLPSEPVEEEPEERDDHLLPM